MARPLDRIWAKVARAQKHVEEFDVALRAFGQSKPYTIGTKEDPDAGKRIYHLARIGEVPLETEAIAADALHNLRATLDHIAYQVEVAAGRTKNLRGIYFPIANSAEEYPAKRAGYIQTAGQAARDAIDATEPYKGGKGHALWQLHELNISDKHHLLLATGAYLHAIDVAGHGHNRFQALVRSTEWGRDITIPEMHVFFRVADPRKLEVGDEISSEPLEFDVDEHFQLAIQVTFDKPGVLDPEPALKTLQDMTNLVRGLVTAFEPLLS